MRRVAFLILVVCAGCSIEPRSDAYRCDGLEDCETGRACVDGWCVVTGSTFDGGIDGSGIDGGPCPVPCTTCDNNVCTVVCAGFVSCTSNIVCPAGMDCVVECDGERSCQGGVTCTDATACTVNCDGLRSCSGTVTCGAGPCTVNCLAERTCSPGPALVATDCGTSCACDTTCIGAQSCDGLFVCPSAGACTTGVGCSSTPAGCDTCP